MASVLSGRYLEVVEAAAQEITRERGRFRADQFHHAGNCLAHYRGTGRELWRPSAGAIDRFVDLGSGGTSAGVTRALKEHNRAVRCFVVEPADAAAVASQAVTDPDHPVQGGAYSVAHLTYLHGVPIDGYVQVTGDARQAAQRMATQEGIFGGLSSGANLAAALKLLSGEYPPHDPRNQDLRFRAEVLVHRPMGQRLKNGRTA
jgi:cysteine synthase A